MRWLRSLPEDWPSDNEVRHVRRFTLLPVQSCDGHTYWLETVVATERYNGGWGLRCYPGEYAMDQLPPESRAAAIQALPQQWWNQYAYPDGFWGRTEPAYGIVYLLAGGIACGSYLVAQHMIFSNPIDPVEVVGRLAAGLGAARLLHWYLDRSTCAHATVDKLLRETNAEERRRMLNQLDASGDRQKSLQKFARLMAGRASVVDQDVDRKGHQRRLLRVKMRNDEDMLVAEVVDPSTRQVYYLRVPPHIRDTQSAVAWTFGLGPRDYAPLAEA